MERVRKFNLDHVTPDQAEEIGFQLSQKIVEITDKAVEDANKILAIYGLTSKMQLVIEKLPETTEEREDING